MTFSISSRAALESASPEAAEAPADHEVPGIRGARTATLKVKLVVLDGDDAGLEFPIMARVVVGADDSAHLVLRDRTVSRRHAEFSLNDGRLTVRDLGSKNGTRLGGERVLEADVPCGSVVTLGNVRLAVRPRLNLREVPPSKRHGFGALSGSSVRMREAFALLERVARSDVPVLLEGECGTGKTLAARALHDESHRAGAPFVALDCAALAVAAEIGRPRARPPDSETSTSWLDAIRAADGGTVLLDDVGALPIEVQPELLHVLETGTLRGPGGPQSVSLRVVAATEHDLGAAVRRRHFRAELLHRLEVVKVRLPPLRERLEDLPLLVEQLAQGRLAPGETAAGEGLTRLTAHFWPGNVRELRDVLERAFALCGPREGLRFADLVLAPGRDEPHPSASAPSDALPFKRAKEQLLKGFEQTYLRALLAKHNGNLSRAAAAAGISRKHIYALLRRSGRPSP